MVFLQDVFPAQCFLQIYRCFPGLSGYDFQISLPAQRSLHLLSSLINDFVYFRLSMAQILIAEALVTLLVQVQGRELHQAVADRQAKARHEVNNCFCLFILFYLLF